MSITCLLKKSFDNFNELEGFIEKWGDETKETFVKKRSDLLYPSNLTNMNIDDEEKQKLCEKLKYKYLWYKCKFGPATKASQSTGERISSTYNHNCGAYIKVHIDKITQKLVIFETNLNHQNHPVHYRELRSTLPEHRRLSDETKKQTIKMLSMGAKTKLVKNDLAENKQKYLKYKDLQNLKSQCKGESDNNLDSFVKLLQQDYNCSVNILKEETTNKFKGIYFCNDVMKKSMEAYPEAIFMDGTYKLFQLNFVLFLLMVQTGNGRGEIVGAAVIKNEDAGTLEWIARCFESENSNACKNIKCFMSDKDLNERNAFIKVFPSNVKFYLCLFHTLKTFNRTIKQLNLDRDEESLSLKLLEKLAYSETKEEYDITYKLMCEKAPNRVIDYFNRNWHANKEEWCKFGMADNNYGNLTNNIVESTNKQIKEIVTLRSTLCAFGKSFFALLKSQKQETDLKSATNHMKRLNLSNTENNVEKRYMDYLTPYAFKKIAQELSIYKKIAVNNYSSETDESMFSIGQNTYKTSSWQCSCHFYRSNNLPCRHILALRAFLNEPIFENRLCADKWTNNNDVRQICSLNNSDRPSDERETSVLNSTKIFETPVRSIKTISQRRKALQEYTNEIVEIGSLATGVLFKKRQELLEKLLEGWRKGLVGEIVFKDDLCDNNAAVKINENNDCTSNTPIIPDVIMPTAVRVRGKPKGASQTTIGFFPRKK